MDRSAEIAKHLAALVAEQRVLADYSSRTSNINISDRSLVTLFAELEATVSAFPEIVQPFDRRAYFANSGQREAYYNTAGLLAFVGNTIGRLKAALDDTPAGPVTQSRSFDYINDAALRTLLQRDYQEIQRAYIAACYKSVIILCGGAIEAILLSVVTGDPVAAKASPKAPSEPDFSRWDLASLIAVSLDLGKITAGAHKLSEPVRAYRNLVHPGVELRNKLAFGHEEARIAIEVLHIVDRDLS